jgi:hypothetical protein
MTFNAACEESKTYTIRPGDSDFNIMGKFTVSRRASIEIDSKCPHYIAQIVHQAVSKGYIVPVATITEREKIFIGLTNEQ